MEYLEAIQQAQRIAPRCMSGQCYVVQYASGEFDVMQTAGMLNVLLNVRAGVEVVALVDYQDGIFDRRQNQRFISLDEIRIHEQDVKQKGATYHSSLTLPMAAEHREPLFNAWRTATVRLNALRDLYYRKPVA